MYININIFIRYYYYIWCPHSKKWQILIFPRGCSMIFEGLPNALSTAHVVRAALLRRSCDGVAAATDMRRPAPSRSFCASRPRRS